MSTAPDSVIELTCYAESSPINATFHRADERSSGRPERTDSAFLDTIIGRRGGLRPILRQVEAVAGTSTTVLITGETGTGKEIIALRGDASRPSWEFACSKFRDQATAELSSRSVAELKKTISRGCDNCSPWKQRGNS